MDDAAFLEELLSIPSPSGAEDAVAEYLAQKMTALGFYVRRDKVGNVIGELGDLASERRFVLLGHIDTVTGLIPVRWEGGHLYGRGAVDAKGPLAAFILAAVRVAPKLKSRLVLIGAVGEEACSRGAHHLVKTMPPPESVIIGEPSSWQGITLGYKGVLWLDYKLVRAANHSAGCQSLPAEKAVVFWNRLVEWTTTLNQNRTHGFDTLDPSLRAIRTFSDGLREGVEMSIALRLPLWAAALPLQQQIQVWREEAELAFPYSEPPFCAEKNNTLVRAFLIAIRKAGGQPRFKVKTGTSDMNVVGPAWRCPIVAYGPGDSTLDHATNEHIEIGEFRRSVDVLAHVLEILCK